MLNRGIIMLRQLYKPSSEHLVMQSEHFPFFPIHLGYVACFIAKVSMTQRDSLEKSGSHNSGGGHTSKGVVHFLCGTSEDGASGSRRNFQACCCL